LYPFRSGCFVVTLTFRWCYFDTGLRGCGCATLAFRTTTPLPFTARGTGCLAPSLFEPLHGLVHHCSGRRLVPLPTAIHHYRFTHILMQRLFSCTRSARLFLRVVTVHCRYRPRISLVWITATCTHHAPHLSHTPPLGSHLPYQMPCPLFCTFCPLYYIPTAAPDLSSPYCLGHSHHPR